MRASDEDRDRVIGRLRRAYHSGALSSDTFELRVGRVVAGRDAEELELLTADCPEPPPSGTETILLRSWSALRRLVHGLTATPAVLNAPPPSSCSFDLGRSRDCNRIFENGTVSRRHARLEWVNGGWVLSDLGSTNGTWVNGWRIDEAWVRDGDRLQLGAVELLFRAPR
jgi:FHA domain/Domain of unknown function (DUF1707)